MDQRDTARTDDVFDQWKKELTDANAVPMIMISLKRGEKKDIKIHKAFGITPDLLDALLKIAAKKIK